MPPRNVCVKLYDVDGCLYHACKKYPHSPAEEWVLSTNEAFLEAQIQAIQRNNINKVIIGYGTNRQDFRTDRYNSNLFQSDSCTPILPLFQSYFKEKLPRCEVVLDPLWMSDIYSGNPAGTSYKAALRERYQNTNESHTDALFDKTKITLIYAHAHRAASLHPKDLITLDFY